MAWSVWSECDDSGLQLRSRVCGAQSTPCVGNSSQHRDCNEIPGERELYINTHTHIYSHGVRLSHYEAKLFPIAVLLLLNKHTLLNPVKLAVVFNRLDVICLLALIHYSGWWSGSVQSEELNAPSLREHELSERNTK